MNAQRYQQICDLFKRVVEQPPQARTASLDQDCAGDADLRREVEALLAADADPLHLDSVPALDLRDELRDQTATQMTAVSPGELPEQIGHYSIRRVIAAGGMGVVYEAMQEHPHRTVALKVLRRGIASHSALRRFEYESQVLARLRHPNVAQVFEAGVHREGADAVPYFAMEYISSARTLLQYAAEKQLSNRQQLELFCKVCDAVHHGHQKGIIHRDLKPANILVDIDGEPKIIDFGVARATDADMAATTMQTDVGQLIGTLQYMSPEQCAADPHDLDSRSDCYALGVVLYELMCGQLPYNVSGAPIPEAVRMIREDNPAKPSTISRGLRGDLETIVLKALAKERQRRYRSAAELADDIRHYLNDEPIRARRPSTFYQLRKFSARNKVLVGSASVLFIVLCAAVAVSTNFAVGQARARDDAELARSSEEQQRKVAEQRAAQLLEVTEFQQSMLGKVDAEKMGLGIIAALREGIRERMVSAGVASEELELALASLDGLVAGFNTTNLALEVVDENVLSRAVATIHEQFADQPVVRAALEQTVANTYRKIGLYDPAMPLQRAALETRRSELGNDHRDTLVSLDHMGVLLGESGKLQEAEPYLREALEGRRRVLGDDHLATLTSINNLGWLLSEMGKLPEAEAHYLEALQGRRRVCGDEHPDTLDSIISVGMLLVAIGKFEDAESYLLEGLETSRRVLGDNHPNTMLAINNMGFLMQHMGRPAESEPYLREALDTRRRELGDTHMDTLISINNMGVLLFSLDRLEEAEPYFREALENSRRVLGNEHPRTLDMIGNLGIVLAMSGKLQEAEPYTREALEGNRRLHGEDHPATLGAINNLGGLLRSLGRLEESEPFYREALEGKRRVLGDKHPDTVSSMSNMATTWLDMGKLDEAAAISEEAVTTGREVLAHGDSNLARYQGVYGLCLTKLKRFAEAEQQLLTGYETLNSGLGAQHFRTTEVIKHLVDLFEAWDTAEPGQGYADKAADWRAKLPQTPSEVGQPKAQQTGADGAPDSETDEQNP